MSADNDLTAGASGYIIITPLDRFMDNVLAARLGAIVHEDFDCHAGDDIDRGLILRRLLHEQGFVVGIPK